MNREIGNCDDVKQSIARRKRFAELLREGKRACKLDAEERTAVIALALQLEKRTREIEMNKKTEGE